MWVNWCVPSRFVDMTMQSQEGLVGQLVRACRFEPSEEKHLFVLAIFGPTIRFGLYLEVGGSLLR